MSEPTEEKKEGKTKKKKGLVFKLVMIFLIVLLLAAAGFAVWHFFFRGDEADDSNSRETAHTLAPLEFTVNLADLDQRRYLKARVALGYSARRVGTELEDNVPELRDLIIDILRSKEVTEIDTVEGTDRLRQEIRNAIDQRLESGQLTEVYFTEFMIQ